jgi:hypothetical protein
MKNVLLLCSAALLSTTISAQLQLFTPDSGEFFTQGVGEYLAISEDVGTTGQVWDFSGMTTLQSSSANFVSVESTNFSKSFANAEIALETDITSAYYAYDGSYQFFGGAENQLIVEYTDSEEYFPLPFNVDDSWEDTFAATFGAAGITFERSGTISTNCLAQGSLTLPGGQVLEDAYRISVSEYLRDSTFLGTYEIFSEGDYWFAADYPLVAFANLTQTTFDTTVGGEPITQESSFSVWMESYTVGLETVAQAPSWSMMPNPASNQLTIARGNFQLPAECVVYGLDGREMFRELIHPGIQVSRLDVSQLTEGVYMVHLGENQQAQRLVIQR